MPAMTPDRATDLVRSSMPLCDTLDVRAVDAGHAQVRLEIGRDRVAEAGCGGGHVGR
jgi:hypothetical protein